MHLWDNFHAFWCWSFSLIIERVAKAIRTALVVTHNVRRSLYPPHYVIPNWSPILLHNCCVKWRQVTSSEIIQNGKTIVIVCFTKLQWEDLLERFFSQFGMGGYFGMLFVSKLEREDLLEQNCFPVRNGTIFYNEIHFKFRMISLHLIWRSHLEKNRRPNWNDEVYRGYI